MTPMLRVAWVGAGGVAVLLGGGVVAYHLAQRSPDPDSIHSRVASPPPAPPSLPGDRMMPDVENAYDQSERRHRAEAERQPGPGASVPPLDTLQPADTLNPQTLRPGDQAALERQRRKADLEQEKQRQQRIQAKAQGMAKVLAVWGGIHQTAEATLQAPVPEPHAAATTPLSDPWATWPVDRVYYGLLRVYISSDEPGPVVVAIKDGALNGARLIGHFKRADEKVVIQFDRMTFQGAWYRVEAVALDPATGRLGLATDVDRRTFTRWAALLGSAVLQGAQRAYLSQGTQNSYLWGQTTTHDFDDREILGIALGEIGTRTRRAATDYFNRPPTVYVDPARQLVGVLFLGPPSRVHEGWVGTTVATPEARASLATPRAVLQAAAARHPAAMPSTPVQDEARSTAEWPLAATPTPDGE